MTELLGAARGGSRLSPAVEPATRAPLQRRRGTNARWCFTAAAAAASAAAAERGRAGGRMTLERGAAVAAARLETVRCAEVQPGKCPPGDRQHRTFATLPDISLQSEN